jgi:serine protease Do
VIWHPEGLIVTNAHVADAEVHGIEYPDGTRTDAWLVARDRKLDLAALAVQRRGLQSVSRRSARTLRVGEIVVAIGHPANGDGALATGIVHRPAGKSSWLLADIRLAPGNSGGPLADAQGNLVGINSMIIGGLGCAVTSDAVETFLRRAQLAEAA